MDLFFRSVVEKVTICGTKILTTTKSMQDRLDGCYTLRKTRNISLTQHVTNKEIYMEIQIYQRQSDGGEPNLSVVELEQFMQNIHKWRNIVSNFHATRPE